MSKLSVLILAAGKGIRMKSSLPKVLHRVGGVPAVERVLRAILSLKPTRIGVVIGHGGRDVGSFVKSKVPQAQIFIQPVLNGSGGAVRVCSAWIGRGRGNLLVTCGDMPLLLPRSLARLAADHRQNQNAATVLTAVVQDPCGYGRIVRDGDQAVSSIVEQGEATEEIKAISEINTGTYLYQSHDLLKALPKLKYKNAKREYYLTDVVSLLNDQGKRVGGVICEDPRESWGINRRQDLAKAEMAFRQRKVEALMAEGVTFLDPATAYVEEDVKIGPDTVIGPQTILQGKTIIGSHCQIGPWANITDCKIENNVIFRASFASSSIIRRGAQVGPFSHIRPQSDLGPGVHLGNFSEVKKSKLGARSKVNHLSYLGDATVGKNVNIGAGTITCNYDGLKKHPTTIEDHVFVGSNANLIAPLRLGKGSVIGAGTSLSQNVPPWSLAVERAPLKMIRNWAKGKIKKK